MKRASPFYRAASRAPPVADAIHGAGRVKDFLPLDTSSGKPATTDVLRKAMLARGISGVGQGGYAFAREAYIHRIYGMRKPRPRWPFAATAPRRADRHGDRSGGRSGASTEVRGLADSSSGHGSRLVADAGGLRVGESASVGDGNALVSGRGAQSGRGPGIALAAMALGPNGSNCGSARRGGVPRWRRLCSRRPFAAGMRDAGYHDRGVWRGDLGGRPDRIRCLAAFETSSRVSWQAGGLFGRGEESCQRRGHSTWRTSYHRGHDGKIHDV